MIPNTNQNAGANSGIRTASAVMDDWTWYAVTIYISYQYGIRPISYVYLIFCVVNKIIINSVQAVILRINIRHIETSVVVHRAHAHSIRVIFFK